MKIPRFRNLFLIGGSLIVVLYLILSDPNGGNLTLPFLAKLATPIIAVWFAHLARKALFDYIDMAKLYQLSKETPVGAAISFLGICVVIFGLLGLFGNQVYAQVPQNAQKYLPTLVQEQQSHWGDHPKQQPLVV